VIEQNSLIYPRLCVLAATLQAAGNSKDRVTKQALQQVVAALIEEDPLDIALKV
jgi:hypothetical protein